MEFTDFTELKNAVRRIGIEKFEAELLEKLELGKLEGDTKNTEHLVLGKYGLYHLEKGVLTKVILHITSIDILWIQRDPDAATALEMRDFENLDFIQKLHKYHFTNCNTLAHMFAAGRRKRYYKAQRMDGTFCYSLLNSNVIVHNFDQQTLNVCQWCLDVLSDITQQQHTINNFTPEKIFHADLIENQSDFLLECDAVPNIYSRDWNKISKKAKEQANWECETCGGNLTNDRQYLHCHHVDGRRSNNLKTNLKVLCIKCHADEPHHAHMRSSQGYQEFIRRYHAG